MEAKVLGSLPPPPPSFLVDVVLKNVIVFLLTQLAPR